MNRCYLIGIIIEIPQYNFFFNSKNHVAKISFSIVTMENKYQNNQVIRLKAYDDVADYIYRYYTKDDIIGIEGRLTETMEVEVLYC